MVSSSLTCWPDVLDFRINPMPAACEEEMRLTSVMENKVTQHTFGVMHYSLMQSNKSCCVKSSTNLIHQVQFFKQKKTE